MLEAARLVKKLTGTKSKIVHKPSKRRSNKKKTGYFQGKNSWWEPKVKFEEGLPGTIKWFRDGI